MRALFAIIRTEIQLLLRDIPGLLILFVMPALLVLVLTTLHSVEAGKTNKISVLIINNDTGKVGKKFVEKLKESSMFSIPNQTSLNVSLDDAKKEVMNGHYQALIVLPKGLTKSTEDYSKWLVKSAGRQPEQKVLRVYLDPTLTVSFKDSLANEFIRFEQKIKLEIFQKLLKQVTGNRKFADNHSVIQSDINFVNLSESLIKPKPSQQYVPAWTIFGMFLIMIPIAGLFVKEREQGIVQRLVVAPIAKGYFLMGRIITFVLINLIQLYLMLSLGIFVLPMLGIDALSLAGHYFDIAIVAIAISFAATGFGVFLGTYVKTFEQAMALGPTLIVIAAALGGIMVPVYLMPEPLKALSEFSPLFWAQNSFIELLVRNMHLINIVPELTKLCLFFLATLFLSTFKFLKRS